MDFERSLMAGVIRLREAIKNPEKLLKRIGVQGVAYAQKAFREQRLGNDPWAKLYPQQADPFISISGALEDFNQGRKSPKASRFDRNPSLSTGARKEIFDSLSSEVVDDRTVEIGSVHPFASSAQFGSKRGDDFTPVTLTAKHGIRQWLYTSKGAVRKGREGYVRKLDFLMYTDTYTQGSLPRPFLGITDEFAADIHRTVEDFFQEKADG